MRNLEVGKAVSYYHESLKNAEFVCQDPVSDVCYFLSDSKLYKFCPTTNQVTTCLDLREDDLFPSENGNEKLVYLSYLIEQDSVCLIFQCGSIFLYNVLDGQVECIGEVGGGIEAAQWSLNGNNLVLITGEKKIIIMNQDFIPLHEVSLFSSAGGESQMISLGWGKSETQFRGSEGKYKVDTEKPEIRQKFSQQDPEKIVVTWSGDGQLFAVSAVAPNSGREVRIFSNEGILQCVTRNIDCLDSVVHWQPSGCLLVSSQRLPNKYQVIFIENNGLQHGEFALPKTHQNYKIKNIFWNGDSSLLAICICKEDDNLSELQVWYRGNYHWYLKQTIKLLKGEEFRSFFWHSEKPLSFTYTTSAGYYKCIKWTWRIRQSNGLHKENDVYVGVIDGDKILLTPFRKVVVPPPEAMTTFTAHTSVNCLLFPKSFTSSQLLAAVLSNGEVILLEVDKSHSVSLKATYSVQWKDDSAVEYDHFFFLHHWIWLKYNLFLAVYTKNGTSTLCKIFPTDEDKGLLTIEPLHVMEDDVVAITFSGVSDDVLIHTSKGQILSYSQDTNALKPWETSSGKILSFPYDCFIVKSCAYLGKELIFGLTENFKLYFEDLQIIDSCSSFDLHNNFLIATTLNHTLQCIPLSFFLNDSGSGKPCLLQEERENERNLERGSRIVTCIPEDTKLILQMPRGNLECIHPRTLVISAVATALNELNFYNAFVLMRRHRINMNLLFDHNPKKFLENIDKFIGEVNNPNWLNVFLTDLCAENITASMYKEIYRLIEPTKDFSLFADKINTVCKAIRASLLKNNLKKYFTVILTTYVLMSPSELEAALLMISDFKRNDNDEEMVDAALNYLQYLVDVNDMYASALGTYNFDLVIMVAQKTQKDPKEYLPFLNELRHMEESYQKFVIDKHLKRPLKALENIAKCDQKYFNECLSHIQAHHLYKKALEFFQKESEQYKEICIAYADYLQDKNRLDEAGIFYHRGGQSDLALKAFEKNLNWQQAMHMSFVTEMDEKAVVMLALRLAAKLKEANQHKDAAFLLDVYAKQSEESIVTLIEGHHWQMALESIHRHRRTDITLTHLVPALKDHSSAFLQNINALKTKFERHTTRLSTLREEKKNNVKNLGSDIIFNDASSEITNASDMSTIHSYTTGTNSRVSGRTCRSLRKEERKKHSLREGSAYEERALLEALSEIVTSTHQMKEECSSLLRMLILFDLDSEGKDVQQNFDKTVQLINEQILQIWKFTPEMFANQNCQQNIPEGLPLTDKQYNTHVQDFRLMMPPELKPLYWKTDFLA